MSDCPTDVIGQIVCKALGNRSPDQFVPQILPEDVKTPDQLTADENEKFSVKGALRKFVPINFAKALGDVETDVYRFARSLTPEHVLGGKGKIDLPEPKPPAELLFHGGKFPTKEVRLDNPLSALPTPPGMKAPPAPQDLLPPLPFISK